MKSKTKYDISFDELTAIFQQANLGEVASFEPLGDGMYNAVYIVITSKGTYVIKISPTPDTKVMTYEKDLLNTEVFWYATMAKKTQINIPKIYAVDLSGSIIPSQYFIMDYVVGQPANKLKKNKEVDLKITNSLCENLAQIHKITSDKFGYIQNTLFDNWYDALSSFVVNCLSDLMAVGKKSKRGNRLLDFIKQNKALLMSVKGCMVNYDIWELNIIANKSSDDIKFTWIDPERGFYGDKIFDFICIDALKMNISKKQKAIDIYNSYAKEKVVVDSNTKIRFAFALGYMALIQETEKFYRYRRIDYGWWFDVISCHIYYKNCFKTLKKAAKKGKN